jgi:catechol 2,3-dioxygenase-like lactoylglutathione lyase family enzyme
VTGLLDHVHIRVRDVDASRRFYTAVGEALELGPLSAGKDWFELGELFVSADGPPTRALHIAFRAVDRQAVERFYERAVAAGGQDNGAPGYRPRYHRGYYAAYVLDPDGNNVEAVVHEP